MTQLEWKQTIRKNNRRERNRAKEERLVNNNKHDKMIPNEVKEERRRERQAKEEMNLPDWGLEDEGLNGYCLLCSIHGLLSTRVP